MGPGRLAMQGSLGTLLSLKSGEEDGGYDKRMAGGSVGSRWRAEMGHRKLGSNFNVGKRCEISFRTRGNIPLGKRFL